MILNKKAKAVLSQGEPRDAAGNFDTYNAAERQTDGWMMFKIHYTRCPVTSTSCGLVTDVLATRPTSPQQVGNKSL